MTEQVDYLDKDTLLPTGQKYVCMSFLTPKKEDNHTLTGIKIRGVFSDYDTACEHAKKVQKIDKYFNVFVGDMGTWLPFDPNPDSDYVKDSEYANDELNKMMKAYKKNQEQAKIFYEQRKAEEMSKNIQQNLDKKESNKLALQDDLEKEKDEKKKKKISFDLESLDKEIKEMEERKNNLQNKKN